jgi:hypothetical protein
MRWLCSQMEMLSKAEGGKPLFAAEGGTCERARRAYSPVSASHIFVVSLEDSPNTGAGS